MQFYTYRLRKGKVMMSLSRGQCYCISLCEEKFSIQLSFVLEPGGRHLAEHRRELLQYFQSNLEAIMKDFMGATSEPIVYIPCCFCNQLHIKLQSLKDEEQEYCPNHKQSAIPEQHYSDLLKDKGLLYKLSLTHLLIYYFHYGRRNS